jgi:hypothetical protein
MEHAVGQGFIEKELTGSWLVTEVASAKSNNDTQLKVVAGFKNSTFVFNADHSFILLTQDKSIYMTMLLRQLAKAKWQFKDATDEVLIGTPQNHFSILKIQLEHNGNATLFNLEESGIRLGVDKK